MRASAIRLLLLGTLVNGVLVRTASADVTVCVAEVRLEKPDEAPVDRQTVQRVNAALANLLTKEREQVHDVLRKANDRRRSVPLRFARAADCTNLTLLIHTTGRNFNVLVMYNRAQLDEPLQIQPDWRFDQPFDGNQLRTLLYQVTDAVSNHLPAIGSALLKSLVREESDRIKSPPIPAPELCPAAERCNVLPKLTLNDYLLSSSFRLEIELPGFQGKREVISTGLGYCRPYGNSVDFGIVVMYQKAELPEKPVRFSLNEVRPLPEGTTCGAPKKGTVSQMEPRGVR